MPIIERFFDHSNETVSKAPIKFQVPNCNGKNTTTEFNYTEISELFTNDLLSIFDQAGIEYTKLDSHSFKLFDYDFYIGCLQNMGYTHDCKIIIPYMYNGYHCYNVIEGFLANETILLKYSIKVIYNDNYVMIKRTSPNTVNKYETLLCIMKGKLHTGKDMLLIFQGLNNNNFSTLDCAPCIILDPKEPLKNYADDNTILSRGVANVYVHFIHILDTVARATTFMPTIYNKNNIMVLIPAIIIGGGFITDNIYYYDPNVITRTGYEQVFSLNGEQYYIPEGVQRFLCYKI